MGLGESPYYEWHKEEKGDILNVVGLKDAYGKLQKEVEDRGAFKAVSDKEHLEIVRLLIEDNLGMGAIGERLNRSSNLKFHNKAIERSGFCPRCKRASGACKSVKAERKHLNEKN